ETMGIGTPESLQYNFSLVKVATNDFSEENKLGKGGFGAVYKGKLEDGQEIAVKRLARDSGQGDLEFKNEVLLVAKLQHRNLVRLLGFSLEGSERLLIYEFLPNASLDQFIFAKELKLISCDYMAPEYAMHGQFSVKSDVFSFGVLVLEMVTSQKNQCFHNEDSTEDLLSFVKWDKQDDLVKVWILGTLEESLQDQVVTTPGNAKALWDHIKDLFHDNKDARAITLDGELRSIKLGSLTINAYCTKIKAMADRLANLGEKVSDKKLVMYALNGLDTLYKGIARLIRHSQPLPKFETARNMLLLEESNLQEATDQANTHDSSSSSPTVLMATKTDTKGIGPAWQPKEILPDHNLGTRTTPIPFPGLLQACTRLVNPSSPCTLHHSLIRTAGFLDPHRGTIQLRLPRYQARLA
nr:hybrid signal transduction histidine kinase M [Tanacetum cinerariifolium]